MNQQLELLPSKKHDSSALVNLHQVLLTELTKGRCAVSRAKLTHVTVLYDQQRIAEEAVTPVSWTVEDIVLIASEVGKGIHHQLAEWKLGAP